MSPVRIWGWIKPSPSTPQPPLPLKKSKKNKQQVICEVHNLGHEEFLICEIRSSVLSVKRREQHTEISKCRMSFFFFFFWREGTDKKKKSLMARP